MKTEYHSHRDVCAVVLFGTPPAVVAVGIIVLTESAAAGIVMIVTGLFVGGIIAALSLPCVYTLTDDSLTIRSGMLAEEIPLRKIRSAEKSSSLWAAPALSLRRLKITLDDGVRVISPKDREGFIADLESRLPRAQPGPTMSPRCS